MPRARQISRWVWFCANSSRIFAANWRSLMLVATLALLVWQLCPVKCSPLTPAGISCTWPVNWRVAASIMARWASLFS
jgi:hypothetical protein